MGSHITKPSNKSMVDRLVEHNSYIRSPLVEGVFRAVDRAMYYDLEEGEAIDPYEDEPWRRGNLHLSAPCIYAKVVEALDLRSGLSFLNLGSGTGYLNTIVGLLVGPNGPNHGIELHNDVVEYAYNRLQQFRQNSYAIDKYDFSEPIFIKGNCLNLNPNSRYDRIYLGAACLPDLETFMKKLIKPNGGILVMPYENHLKRYIRLSETEWRSEKLMDVNFTLMIRQGDNESMIDMPLAQAKSLKELCRITIRQQLRDKTNSINPNLLHSDNISSRRMRKARAERKMLQREEQRSKSKDLHFFDNKRRDHGTTARKSKSRRRTNNDNNNELDDARGVCGCRINRRMVEEVNMEPSTTTNSAKPGSSSSEPQARVMMTRSASRRLENNPTDTPITDQQMPEQGSVSSDNLHGHAARLREQPIRSDSEEDDHRDSQQDEANEEDMIPAHRRKTSSGGNCARTRPYSSCTMRAGRPSAYHRSSALDRDVPPLLLPFQRRMARIIDPPSSPSSSESSDLQELDEYDYIGRRVVLDWPGFLRIHNADPAYDIADAQSISSESTLSSGDEELILDDSASEDSWNSFFDNFHNDYDDTMDDGISSSLASRESDDYEDEFDLYDEDVVNVVDDDHVQEDSLTSTIDLTTSRRSTSYNNRMASRQPQNDASGNSSSPRFSDRHKNNTCDGKRPKSSKTPDHEPVARRLRSKTGDNNPGQAMERPQSTPGERPVPGCSRNESIYSNHDPNCPLHRKFRCRSNNATSKRQHGQDGEQSHQPKLARASASASSSLAPNQQSSTQANTHNSNSHHQQHQAPAARHSSESSSGAADIMSSPNQGLFTGRVLIATALGTTLSLAAHHYHHHIPSTSRSGSFRLFERRSLPGKYHHHCHHHLHQLDRKRKRHSSSSDSSCTSGDDESSSSPSRRSVGAAGGGGQKGRSRRRCECTRSSQTTTTTTTRPNDLEVSGLAIASSATSSSTASRHQLSAINARPGQRREPNNPSAAPESARLGSHLFSSTTTDEMNLVSSSSRASQSDNGGGGSGAQSHDNSGSSTCSPGRNIASNSRHNSHQHNLNNHHQPQQQQQPQALPQSNQHRRGHQHHRHNHHHRHHHHRNICQGSLESKRSKRADQTKGDDDNEKQQQQRRKTRDARRHGNECERYHGHISAYIRQLSLPRVLHNYLDYERNPR